jgi:ribosomal protein S18 acetylase RimI-like enzyme
VAIEIRLLRAGEERILEHVDPDVFDHAIDPEAARAFLADPRLHLAVAIDDGVVVGMVSAVHYHHPDKPVPELWIDEAGVASTHQGRGLGKALLAAMFAHGRELGCAQAWVLTERTNEAALRLYRAAGGVEESETTVMLSFALDDPAT